jgi:hypothetical protein
LFLAGQAAWADEEYDPPWTPSIMLGFDTFSYDAEATVENNLNPPAHEGTQTNPKTQLRFQFGGEVMSPMLPLPGRPRLFVQGGGELGTFSSDRIFAIGDLNGDPEADILQFKTLRQRDILAGCKLEVPWTCLTSEPGAFEGQGSRIDAKVRSPAWFAALGVSFDVPMTSALLLQVKPSAAYNVETVDLSGQITTVELTNPVNQKFAVHRGSASDSSTEHSLGFGLELGLVMFRSARPVTTSLYADARFLWALGDTATTFSDPGGLATFTVDRENFMIRGGAGVRFSWLGFAGR